MAQLGLEDQHQESREIDPKALERATAGGESPVGADDRFPLGS